MQLFMCIA